MKQLFGQLTAACLLFAGCTSLYAQSPNTINVVTTAVPFLRISPDARAGGMGDVGVATTPDASSAYWNLGKIPFNTEKAGLTANYTPWLRDWASDMYLASLSGYYKIDELQAIHGSLRYFDLGNLQFSDNMGNHLQSFHPREYGLDAGYSRKLSDKIGIGLGIKYIRSDLATNGAGGSDYKAGNAVAADLGFYYDAKKASGEGWSFGAALSNLGSKISYSDNASQKDFIPANLGLGVAYTQVFNEQNKIQFGLDINKLLVPTPPSVGDSAGLVNYHNKTVMDGWFSSFGDAPGGFSEELKEYQISAGAEYWYNDQFAFRAGYFYEDKTKGNRRYFSTGLTVKYSIYTVNFSYQLPSGSGVDRNPLSNTLRFGLTFNLK
jgi:hypothetical protein